MKLKRIPPAKAKRTMKKQSGWLASTGAGLPETRTAATGIEYPPPIDGRWHYPILRITCANLSVEGAVEGGYGGVFGSVSSDDKCHVMEVSTSLPTLGADGVAQGVVFGRQVVGALKTSDNSGSLSYAVARATVGVEKNSLNVETTGLPDNAVAAVRKLAGQTLTAESARTFGEGIGECLKWTVEHAKGTSLADRPAPLYEAKTAYDNVKSLCYAMGQLAKGNSLDGATKQLGAYHISAGYRATYAQIEPVLVAALYHRFRVSTTPSATVRQQAGALLQGSGVMPGPNHTKTAYLKAVLPYTMPDGAIASLAHLGPPEQIKAGSWPPPGKELSQPKTRIGNDELTLHAALDIGLGILGDLHLKNDMRFCGFLSWSTYRRVGVAGTMILEELYGAGIRASIRYSGNEIKGGATQLAAKVTLDKTAASFSIDILGVDIHQLPSIGAFASGAATVFDAQTLSLIGGIWSEVNAVITAHDDNDAATPLEKKEAWKPCLTGVQLNLGADELQRAAGTCGPMAFALARLANGTPLDKALAQAPDGESKAAVQRFYAGLPQPGSDARKEAKSLLRLGS
jgi:hypothetical protein